LVLLEPAPHPNSADQTRRAPNSSQRPALIAVARLKRTDLLRPLARFLASHPALERHERRFPLLAQNLDGGTRLIGT
jgi:hypothetical protein